MNCDFSLRTIVSVIRYAGILKQKFVTETEDIIIVRSLNDLIVSRLSGKDTVVIYNGLVKDMFGSVKVIEGDRGSILLHLLLYVYVFMAMILYMSISEFI